MFARKVRRMAALHLPGFCGVPLNAYEAAKKAASPCPRPALPKMSEVISLREKVAQAEFAVRVLNLPLAGYEEMAELPQKVTTLGRYPIN
ncbi:hypothetical protein V1283_001473 [Bradyrhizobium sp. AZCC 2262]|uniref:hypothetical protein n=1 Tax=Bradyrhizobium sp. AZCC 2262 TaxID=3117022 RepID=UPI002FF1E4C8